MLFIFADFQNKLFNIYCYTFVQPQYIFI